ncbi:hypothetical protein BD779DRAFT_1607360 [Infundibulicybe gibba]|nr:hypothetical protein BD779DRAFT_1607360 [Infundibulicybe gibba]
MGFCRRCGDIVAGARCKCGGMAVAPVVPWNQSDPKEKSQDRWSKTYVSKERSPTRPLSRGPSLKPHMTGSSEAPSVAPTYTGSPTKRFPRPGSSSDLAPGLVLGNRVSAHIASAASYINRPLSPLKFSTTLPAPESDILHRLSPTTLHYPRYMESLTKHACGICTTPFSPDATIYPDPSTNGNNAERFLCRSCFTTNGGSKGTCPTCSRPVLTLKSEGGFIHAAEKYWHKRCFNCIGCHKNIGNSPMVDLLGRPSCAECFDDCLNREPNTPKKNWGTNSPRSDANINIGGMNKVKNTYPGGEASPALEELEQRLGIVKSRESSPTLEELSQRLNMIGRERYSASGSSPITSPAGRRDSRPDGSPSPIRRYDRFKSPDHDHVLRSTPIKYSQGSPSPVRSQVTGSPVPTQEAIEEMKQRFLKNSTSTHTSEDIPISTRPLRPARSSSSLHEASKALTPAPLPVEPTSPKSPTAPATPDLMSDFSDTMTQSSWSGPESSWSGPESSWSGSDSPPRNDTNGDTDLFSVSKLHDDSPRYVRGDYLDRGESMITEEANSQLGTPTHTPKSDKLTSKSPLASTPSRLPRPTKSFTSPPPSAGPISMKSPPTKLQGPNVLPSLNGISGSAVCAKCKEALFSVQDNGKYVTVPADGKDGKPQTYHRECFRCMVCEGVFREGGQGQAVFVKANGGPCHVEMTIRKMPSVSSLSSSSSNPSYPSPTPPTSTPSPSHTTSSRYELYERPPVTAPVVTPNAFPRFGTRTACPGCHKSVSPMEFGVVPGPQGTRWHSSCLICGGKKAASQPWNPYRPREEKKRGEPGCGKKLDSAAKGDGEGGIWCRECLLLLGIGGSPQASPTREPLVSLFTGSSSKLVSQSTGTTTIARQFTGLGGDGLSRQLTGSGFAPTRSVSPTKQLGGVGTGPGTRPRPKSVIGMRNTKSIDEGRGMFLVRQLTGGTSNCWAE